MGGKGSGNVSVFWIYFAMVCHCREKLDTEEGPTREEIDFVDIAFPPVCAATSVGIHSSELITAPAPARRIVITLPTRLLASRFFPSQIDLPS